MQASKVRIGILGAGSMGAEHAYCYRQIAGAEIAGIFSRNVERAKALAQQCDAAAYADARLLIADPNVDAIDVCVPSENHRAFVVEALASGKHVFCETPFALSMADSDAMIEAAKKAKRVLLVGLLLRSAAHYEHIGRVALSGEHGAVLSVTTFRLGSYLRPGAPDHKSHYSDPSTELMTFDFDFVNTLLGRPNRLSATGVKTETGAIGEISAVLDYGGSKSATVLASGIMPIVSPFTAGFRVLFERAVYELVMTFGDGPPTIDFRVSSADGPKRSVEIAGHNPYEKELQHFVDCVRSGTSSPLLGPEHAVAALELSLATQRALRDGVPARLG
jgi:predicted dehydrogenase